MFEPAAPSDGPAARAARLLLSPWCRLALLAVVLACAAAAMVWWQPQRLLTGELPEPMTGPGGLVVYAVAYGVCTTAFVPRPFLNLAAGAVFGSSSGSVTALAGTVLGAGFAFGLGRWLGQDALRRMLRARWLTAADRQLSEHGFRSMLVVRLLPGLPFWGTNYCAAVSRMRWSSFLLATAVGSVPNTVAYTVAGARATAPTSPAFLLAMAFIAVSGLVAAGFAWRKRAALRGG
ncbi:TVP38/TMEM64 family protein [Streptomyces catenulae]|uniref:TVP38/TMEM64 family membrane protein n=1 Tax=Streptomyces catenulae TaxID=66875 RepID=A0ABV2Z292_9ACTN|nr:TVP38/TMEM64 family protein [Streptomyces catenulae]